MKGVRADPRPFLEQMCWIRTKGNVGEDPMTRLVLNGPQMKAHRTIETMRAEGLPPRIISLKARQPGMSTYCEGRVFTTAMSQPYKESMVVSHLDEQAESLFSKVLFMRDHLPSSLQPSGPKPRKDHLQFDSIQCLDGRFLLHSQIHVATASGKELWRGLSLLTVHLSEFALFPYAQDTLLGILQAVPASPDSLVMIESTARGMGNAFHEEWVRAEAGESGFRPVFIPWFELPDAHMPAPKDFERTTEEEELAVRFKLTNEQLQWRRWKLYTECGGNTDYFDQEFPDTPASAFLHSGRPAFPIKKLQQMADRAVEREDYGVRGELTGDGFVRHRTGNLVVYQEPRPDYEYVISADPSSGVETRDSDPAAMHVFCRNTHEIVAVWHGHLVPTLLGIYMARLGKWYNNAILAPELNNGHGFTVVEELKNQFYPIHRIYMHRRFDRVTREETAFLGWETNMRTRALLVDSMHWGLIHGDLMCWHTPTIKELMEFQWINGRPEGLRHDDLAMSVMIAYRAHLESPLEATGLRPRLHIPGDDEPPPQAEGEEVGVGFGAAIWEEVEQEMNRRKHRRPPGSGWGEYDQPDKDPGEASDWEPPGGLW